MTSQPLSLRLNFSWNLIGNIIYAACQWGILIVFTKLTNVEMVGHFALGLAITAPVILFSQMGLRGAQATDARDEYRFGDYLALRLIATIMALIAIVGIAFLGGYERPTIIVILLVGLSKAVESVADVFYGLMQRHERMDRIARSRIIKGISSLIVLSLVVFITRDIKWGVLSLALLWTVVFVFYDIRSAKATLNEYRDRLQIDDFTVFSPTPIFDMQILRRLVLTVLPLGFIQALISLKTNIPIYYIEHHCGASELGIFSSLSYLVIVGNTLVSAMSQACVPRLSLYYAKGKRTQYHKMIYKLVAIGALIGCLGVLVAAVAGKPLLTLIYRPEYGERVVLFVLILSAGAISYIASILGYALMATRQFNLFLFLHLILTGITYTASMTLIPRYGVMGAAGAGAIAQFCSCILMIALLIRTR